MKKISNLLIILLFLVTVSCKSEEAKTEEKSSENTTEKKLPEGQVELSEKELNNAKLKIIKVKEITFPEYLKATGEIEENENFVTHVNSKVSGRVIKVNKSVGQTVAKGDILAIIESKEISNLQSEILENQNKIKLLKNEINNKIQINKANINQQQKYIDFLQQAYNRQQQLYKDDIAPRKNVEEADKNLKTAILEKEKIVLEGQTEIQRLKGDITGLQLEFEKLVKELQLFNFSQSQIKQVLNDRNLNSDISIYAPVSGLISQKHISLGEIIEPETEIFTLSDPSAIWGIANIYEKDLHKIKVGQKAIITPKSYDKVEYQAKVSYIFPQIDEQTRTAKVRLSFDNKTNLLRKGMFTDILISVNSGNKAIAIPKEALQRDGTKEIVFEKKSDSLFQSIDVKTGKIFGNMIEIKQGLKGNENIVSEGSFTLKSISKKGEMGEE